MNPQITEVKVNEVDVRSLGARGRKRARRKRDTFPALSLTRTPAPTPTHAPAPAPTPAFTPSSPVPGLSANALRALIPGLSGIELTPAEVERIVSDPTLFKQAISAGERRLEHELRMKRVELETSHARRRFPQAEVPYIS